ncbi:S-methyl-5'-thioadenosine phosphorylase-like isoform X2 [Teleopsis dalmanni]|nr:S-methyl-5'-thioadenosine phosphorylase-like isoform X2 [Teleopsis dalmanni]XP_037959903.1 S-methyl-5'-thioadenosine phosphorylase-like isoform X2 [Teleopsis dalmanni]
MKKKLSNIRELKFYTPYGTPSDTFVEGDLHGLRCVILARHNRKNFIRPEAVNSCANIWGLQQLGVTHVLSVFAGCSLMERIQPGDFVIPDDFIDLTGLRTSLYRPPKRDCHVMMKPAFSELLTKLLMDAADELRIEVHKGGLIMASKEAICYTNMQSSMYRIMGGHLVTQNIVPEAVLSKEAGLFYSPFSIVVSYDSCFKTRSIDFHQVVDKYVHNLKLVTDIFSLAIDKIQRINWTSSIIHFRNMLMLSRPKLIRLYDARLIISRRLMSGESYKKRKKT